MNDYRVEVLLEGDRVRYFSVHTTHEELGEEIAGAVEAIAAHAGCEVERVRYRREDRARWSTWAAPAEEEPVPAPRVVPRVYRINRRHQGRGWRDGPYIIESRYGDKGRWRRETPASFPSIPKAVDYAAGMIEREHWLTDLESIEGGTPEIHKAIAARIKERIRMPDKVIEVESSGKARERGPHGSEPMDHVTRHIEPCGCKIEGAGTLQSPARIAYCDKHAALELEITVHHEGDLRANRLAVGKVRAGLVELREAHAVQPIEWVPYVSIGQVLDLIESGQYAGMRLRKLEEVSGG